MLCVSEGDHRPVAAATGDSNKDMCDFQLPASEGARLGCLHPRCAKGTAEQGFKVHY